MRKERAPGSLRRLLSESGVAVAAENNDGAIRSTLKPASSFFINSNYTGLCPRRGISID